MTYQQILFIDEDPEILDVVSRRLSGLGYRVVAAQSADEARRVASEVHPSLILIDRGLPGDGEMSRRILSALKQDPAVSQIPVMMTSARKMSA
jgi:CheY-like chemotaxis protein